MGVSTVRGSGGVSDIAIIHSSRRAGTVLTYHFGPDECSSYVPRGHRMGNNVSTPEELWSIAPVFLVEQ